MLLLAKFIMVDFYEMDFMKGMIVKIDDMDNILKSASDCLLVEI